MKQGVVVPVKTVPVRVFVFVSPVSYPVQVSFIYAVPQVQCYPVTFSLLRPATLFYRFRVLRVSDLRRTERM